MENTLLMSCFAQSGPAALVAFLFSPPPGHKDRPNKELKITRRSNKTRQKEEEGQQQKQEQQDQSYEEDLNRAVGSPQPPPSFASWHSMEFCEKAIPV